MKYRIKYRRYSYPRNGKLEESLLAIVVQSFKIKKGFVSMWFEYNDTQIPDFYINVDDVLTIERVD